MRLNPDKLSELMACLACVAPLICGAAAGQSDDPSANSPARAAGRESHPPDCGIIALADLMALENVPLDLKVLLGRLPSPPEGGYSLAELREAARDLGITLEGVRIQAVESAIDRPMLVHLKRGPHGHFVVIRPVGHSGKLVQLIDPFDPPEVVDKTDLFQSATWTGVALIPTRSTGAVKIAAVLLISFTLAWIFLQMGRAGCRSRPLLGPQ